MRPLRVLGAPVSLLVLAACGDPDAPTTTETEPPPAGAVTLELEKLSKVTTDSSIEVKGTVTENARVTANGEPATVEGERFSVSLPLDLGKNTIRVLAGKPGFEEAREVAQVTRQAPSVAADDEAPPETSNGPAPTEPGYPPPGECGVSPNTGDPVCRGADGELRYNPDALP